MAIPSWDEYFFNILEVVKTRSSDPRTHVACLFTKGNKILSTGYNGFPSGMDIEVNNDNKYTYMVHAEQNAVANAVKLEQDMSAYITHLPCHVCLRLIWNAGVRQIFVPANRKVFSYSDDDWKMLAAHMASGLELKVGNYSYYSHSSAAFPDYDKIYYIIKNDGKTIVQYVENFGVGKIRNKKFPNNEILSAWGEALKNDISKTLPNV